MLIDTAKIYITAGNGGNGCQSLYKDIYHRRGVPDGGDGGNGGNVIIRSNPNLSTLLDYKYNQHHGAENGKHGGPNKKHGRRGTDLIVNVPIGTIVKDFESGLVIRDLSHEGEQVIVANGGAGGRGNAKVDPAEPGQTGEIKTIQFELKLVADIGIIGFPNAGKSTLISRITKAHSKIAPYPFTTKSPKLGVVSFDDDTFVVADMPGLIEGAHEGKGLGDRFLRHIERTSILVHMVDIFPLDGSDPVENYLKLEKELELYDSNVYKKTRIVVANKVDIPGADDNFSRFKDAMDTEVYRVSALTGEGIKDLIKLMYKEVKNAKTEDETDNYKNRYSSPD